LRPDQGADSDDDDEHHEDEGRVTEFESCGKDDVHLTSGQSVQGCE
jgi:hypothetical protein